MDPAMPPILGDAIETEPFWLQAWVFALGAVHFAAVAFVIGGTGGGGSWSPNRSR